MNKTKGSLVDERAIASGTQVFLCCVVGESVAGRQAARLSENA